MVGWGELLFREQVLEEHSEMCKYCFGLVYREMNIKIHLKGQKVDFVSFRSFKISVFLHKMIL